MSIVWKVNQMTIPKFTRQFRHGWVPTMPNWSFMALCLPQVYFPFVRSLYHCRSGWNLNDITTTSPKMMVEGIFGIPWDGYGERRREGGREREREGKTNSLPESTPQLITVVSWGKLCSSPCCQIRPPKSYGWKCFTMFPPSRAALSHNLQHL